MDNTEPKVNYCTVRDAINYGIDELHIECRFDDGQKFAAIVVDGEFEGLAFAIRDFLNSEQYKNLPSSVGLSRTTTPIFQP